MLKNILAVLSGYILFGLSAVLLFILSGIDPHADPSIGVFVLTLSVGLLFAFLGGLLAQLISRAGNLRVNYLLAGIMAGFATFSLLNTTGNHYSQWAAILLFAPASILGGLVYLKRINK